tara:strand:- start:201 stop:455 length:255 start_codon:yes stop_codon:yes gene_type:complete
MKKDEEEKVEFMKFACTLALFFDKQLGISTADEFFEFMALRRLERSVLSTLLEIVSELAPEMKDKLNELGLDITQSEVTSKDLH